MVVIVKPISAVINKGYDYIFFKRSPYLICILGIEKQVTKSHIAGGKEPKWVDTLLFNAKGPEMKVMLCDKTLLREDNVLGQGYVSLINVYNNPQKPQIEFVDIKKGDQTVARVQLSIEYLAPPHVFDNTQKKQLTKENQKINKEQEQYKRMSSMLSSGISSLFENTKNIPNVQITQRIQQPINRMAMSTVTNCHQSPNTELNRRNSLSHLRNNNLNIPQDQYIPPQNYPSINQPQLVTYDQVVKNESNPLKILQKASLNVISSPLMIPNQIPQFKNTGPFPQQPSQVPLPPFPQVQPPFPNKILMKGEQQPDVLDLDENNPYGRKSTYD